MATHTGPALLRPKAGSDVTTVRVLVTGGSGQLARSLAERGGSHKGVDLLFAQRPEFDLLNEHSITRVIADTAPHVVINAAAYTSVDQAEDEPELAHALNAVAPGKIASACRRARSRMIQISTDYVFDGKADGPYSEDASVAPIGIYGRTKLAGEIAVKKELPEHTIIRTSWVYSPFGNNFVKTMIRLAEQRPEVSVVADQIGNPTAALDLADALLRMIDDWRREKSSVALGEVLHVTGTGAASWADFARTIFAISGELGGAAAVVKGISSEQWLTKAERPRNSCLDTTRFTALFGFEMPDWKTSLVTTVARLVQAGDGATGKAKL